MGVGRPHSHPFLPKYLSKRWLRASFRRQAASDIQCFLHAPYRVSRFRAREVRMLHRFGECQFSRIAHKGNYADMPRLCERRKSCRRARVYNIVIESSAELIACYRVEISQSPNHRRISCVVERYFVQNFAGSEK